MPRRLLPFGSDGLDGVVQLALRGVKVLFRLCAMASHIIVVGFASMVQLVDRFLHVGMNLVYVMPIVNSVSDCHPGSKR